MYNLDKTLKHIEVSLDCRKKNLDRQFHDESAVDRYCSDLSYNLDVALNNTNCSANVRRWSKIILC